MKKLFEQFNMRAFIYTLIIWIVLNVSGIQNMYFYGGDIFITMIVKILHLIFLYTIISKIHSLFNKRKETKVKNEIIISLIYFAILVALLLLVWPGTWSWDDITILNNASSMELTPWHHFFSGLFQTLCLQTIPIPSGVIIIQIVIASLIVGYCISNISTLYGKNNRQIRILQIVLGLITLLPPLIMYVLSGFRMGIYSYLELLLITKIIILYKENKQATFNDILKISLLTIIISCWRTEALYYPLFILALYLILGNKVIRKKVAIIVSIIIIITNFGVTKINNLMIGNNDYSLTATMEPVTSIIKISDESDKEEIETINKVIDVEYVLENPEKTGELYYWTTGVVKDYTEEQYSDYLKAYIKLALKYPNVAFNSWWNIFVKAGSGEGDNSKQTTHNMVANTGGETLELFNIRTMTGTKWNRVPSLDLRVKSAINEDIRKTVILLLNGTDENGDLTLVHNIFWNLFIPFTLILICLIYKLIKKDWFMVFLILTVIARIPLVFVTAPAAYFMYYLSTYLCTYVIIALVGFEILVKASRMIPMNNSSKIFDKKLFLFTFIVWLGLNISGIQKIFFTTELNLTAIIVKVLHLVFLYIIFKKIKSLYVNRKNPKVKNEILIASIYFIVLFFILLWVWPGTWSNDDIVILRNAQTYSLTPWHHFFSGLFHVLCLQTIPIPAGVIIIQILIASLIGGYCLSNIAELFGKNDKQKTVIQVILGLITLFPPLIMYILSGFRMGIYSYLELLLITKLIIVYKNNKELDLSELLVISFLTIIISCWRTEGIYYPFFVLILYFILGKKVINRKVAIISFFIIMAINFSIGKINNWMIGNNDYSIAATMEGVTSVVEASDESDKEELEAINKIVDVEFIKNNPDLRSEEVFKRVGIGQEYTDEEYGNYLKAYLKLLLKYPDAAFKNMWNMFLNAGSGFGEDSKQTTNNMVYNYWSMAQDLFKDDTMAKNEWSTVNSKYKGPIYADLRHVVILFLNGSYGDKRLTIIHNIFWNLLIPFTLILICLIYKLIKKDWFMVFLILTVVVRIPIVFATAPAAYFMYYLSAYLCTYILSAIVIIDAIINFKNKKKIGGLLCEKKS